MIKKIDFSLQLLILLLLIFCFVWFSIVSRSINIFAFLLLPMLSTWQIISAVLNLLLSHNQNVKRVLSDYWKVYIPSAVLLLLSLCFSQQALDNNDILPMALMVAGIAAGAFVSIYYLSVYRRYFLANKIKH